MHYSAHEAVPVARLAALAAVVVGVGLVAKVAAVPIAQ